MTFKTTNPNGFHVTFANGYLVSVQWNSGNYCSDRILGMSEADRDKPRECALVEVAAWNTLTADWVKLSDHDDVAGWQTPDQVLAIMNKVAALPNAKDQ